MQTLSPFSIKSIFLLALAAMLTFEAYAFQKESPGPVKIGLLITDNRSSSAINGAKLAVKIANEKSGRNQISLVVKSMEGQWGNGSKQAISLIFEDKVAALLGSCDGRNAHLVEQAATRSHVVFISAFSGDPTLSKAFVPWFFNCVHDYDQQAELLVAEICNKMKFKKIMTVTDNSYDSNLAFESFEKRASDAGCRELQKAVYVTGDNLTGIIDDIRSKKSDALVLFLNSDEAGKINAELKKSKINIQVYCTNDLSHGRNEFENIFYISQVNYTGNAGKEFAREYQKAYGSFPDHVAALTFDGINLLIEAIASGGTKNEGIQKALAGIHLEGVTGSISFDEKGRRSGIPVLIQIKKGTPVTP